MEMELYPLLSAIILVATIVTVVLALFSYLAYRARGRKQERLTTITGAAQPAGTRLFKRFEPGV